MSERAAGPCLAVIPARGGSKRVAANNVRRMRGRPLIAYTIEAALDSQLFERVVASTDSPEIAAVARENGAEVPFLRAAALSDDIAPVSAVTLDSLDRLDPEGRRFSYVCQLMPNCPLRTAADVLESFHQFVETGAQSQLSVTSFGFTNPWWAMRRAPDMFLEPLFADRLAERSQDLPELLCPSGAVWWARPAALRQEGTFHCPGRTGWKIAWKHGVDIDTEEDWLLAEALMGMPVAETR